MLVAVNLIVNYFLLLATAKFLKLSVSRRRLVLGALLGAVYSLYILLPELLVVFSMAVKLFMSVTIVLLAFGYGSLKRFVRALLCFYFVNFGFAGIMFGIWYVFAPKGLIINNGVVYFQISPIILLLLTLCCYIVFRIISRVTGREEPDSLYCTVEFMVDGKKGTIKAKVDTGNALCEPFSGLPVMVTEFESIAPLLPKELREFCGNREEMEKTGELSQNTWKTKCRMVPFQSIGGTGVLPAFRPDSFLVKLKKGTLKKVAYIAVCQKGMLKEDFSALINPELANE